MPQRKSDDGSRVTLPITPMLDMTFQLLFFFIMNFNPADLEGQMDMSLPAEEQAPVAGPIHDAPAAGFPASWTVVVRAKLDGVEDGEIGSVSLRNPQGKVEPLDGLAGLKKLLGAQLQIAGKLEHLKVEGDPKLKVGRLLRVVDACRESGVSNVSLGTTEQNR